MPAIYSIYACDWENDPALVLDLPEGAQVDIETRQAGSVDYQAGTVDVDSATIDAYLNGPAPAGDRFALIEGVYIRVTGASVTQDGGRLTLDRSRVYTGPPQSGGDELTVLVVEPSPPTHPLAWFWDEVDRARADLLEA